MHPPNRRGARNTARQNRNQSSADFQVCCVAGFRTRKPRKGEARADLEIGDTAGLETCATTRQAGGTRRSGQKNGGGKVAGPIFLSSIFLSLPSDPEFEAGKSFQGIDAEE